MRSLNSKITAKLEARRNGESGLALLDVLLGMAIFALIAVIAVQAMGSFRERAYISQVTSDAKQVGTGIEAYLTGPNVTFDAAAATLAGANLTDLSTLGVNLTGSNAATIVFDTTLDTYTVCVDGNNKNAVYSSAKGSIDGAPGSGNCP